MSIFKLFNSLFLYKSYKLNQMETTEKITNDKNNPTDSEKPNRSHYIKILVIIALFILIPLIIYLIKQSEINKLKKAQQAEIELINHQADSLIEKNNLTFLETLTKVFSWAVRSEILRNNLEQVNTYMIDLVKTTGYNDITLIKPDGIVALSTNKKYEGTVYPGPLASELRQIEKAASMTDDKGNILSVCPVMGLDSRLGTIVITYAPAKKTDKEQLKN